MAATATDTEKASSSVHIPQEARPRTSDECVSTSSSPDSRRELPSSSLGVHVGATDLSEETRRRTTPTAQGGVHCYDYGSIGHLRASEEVSVILSQRCAKFLSLQVGHHIRIHPPW